MRILLIINYFRLKEDPFPIFQKRIDYKENQEDAEFCGVSSGRVFYKRIIGGKQANFGEFPWQVHIKIGTYQCGGVLGK